MKREVKTYQNLLVWQKGIEIVKMAYSLCRQMPKEELFALQSQIKRASVSVPSNIAEGYGQEYTKNYLRFLKIARGSLYELETQMIIARDLNFIEDGEFQSISNLMIEENKMLNAFIRSIESS